MADTRYPHLSDRLLKEVDWFADQMKKMLEWNHHKGDSWADDDVSELAIRTKQESDRLLDAVLKADRNEGHRLNQEWAIEEAADAANMAMFTAVRLRQRIPPYK